MPEITQRPIIQREDIGNRPVIITFIKPPSIRLIKDIPALELLEAIENKETDKEWREKFIQELSFRKYDIDRTQCYTGVKPESTWDCPEIEAIPIYMIPTLRLLNILSLINFDEHVSISFNSSWHTLLLKENNVREKYKLKEGDLELLGVENKPIISRKKIYSGMDELFYAF